jgi:Ca2+-binding EF-hand superfamily protein
MTTMNKKIGFGLAALGTLFTLGGGIALACEHDGAGAQLEGRRGRFMAKFDTNGDGTLSPEERAAAHAAMLKKLDTNGDGVVSDEERAAARHEFAQRKLARLDTNHDGVISLQELEAGMQHRMERHRGEK